MTEGILGVVAAVVAIVAMILKWYLTKEKTVADKAIDAAKRVRNEVAIGRHEICTGNITAVADRLDHLYRDIDMLLHSKEIRDRGKKSS